MDLWKKTLTGLQEIVEPWDYSHWIQPVQCNNLDEKAREITLAAPDESHGRWVQDHFASFIQGELKRLTQADYRIHFTTYGERPAVGTRTIEVVQGSLSLDGHARSNETVEAPARVERKDASEPTGQVEDRPPLFEKYTFGSFVDGPTNQFAMTAARAVADHPGLRYNPLFIFGGVGLGKTHLLHAVGIEVLQRNPRARVRYVTSEVFVNDLITAIRTDKMQAFRSRYRDRCDVLLVDDIQFIAGKDRTQEEFFHLFNTLHGSGKQIVLTCDQLPQSIPDMEDRLKSRLQWGLIADIKPPGFETRVAILKSKAEVEGVELPDDVAMLVARHVTRNVRELEGALKQLLASSKMLRVPITVGLVEQALGTLLGERLEKIAPDAILKAVSADFKVSLSDLKGPRRHRNITIPRQIAMYLVRELTDESLPQIGALFGGRDHSTVINSLKRVEALRDANPETRSQIDRIRRSLRD